MSSLTHLTAAKIASWKLIAVKVKPFLETMPAFTDRHAEMERVITESEDLEIRQKQLKSELQELNHRRGELATQGEDLRARLAALIQAEHGFQSKLLIEFGVKPRQRRSRAKKLPGEQPTVTPQ